MTEPKRIQLLNASGPDMYLDPAPYMPQAGSPPGSTQGREVKLEAIDTSSNVLSMKEQFRHESNREDINRPYSQQDQAYYNMESNNGGPVRISSYLSKDALDVSAQNESVPDTTTELGETVLTDGKKTDLNRDCEPIRPKRISSLPHATRIAAEGSKDMYPPEPATSHPIENPPKLDAELELPFDFHRFLEQLRHRTADPVARYLRSFLVEFGRKQWMVNEQVKLISDFLEFITNRMSRCEVWRDVYPTEFDNAKEGMEKLVMNRLYVQTFSPTIPPPATSNNTNNVSRNRYCSHFGRRGQHQEDIERDEVLGQKIRIYNWVQEEHLDTPRVTDNGRRFLLLAQQELLKIETYRAPRDKVICVLNCCKVIFGILRNSKHSDTSADSFVPLLIYVVLHANPKHLVSNVQYIMRFRNPDKLGGEAGYYLSSLMGAIQFIENLDRTALTISDDDFERNVEAAVSAIAEKPGPESSHQSSVKPPPHPTVSQVAAKSTLSEPEGLTRNPVKDKFVSPRYDASSHERLQSSGNDASKTAVGGLLRTVGKPMSKIGRFLSEEPGQPSSRRSVPLTSAVLQSQRVNDVEDDMADGKEQTQFWEQTSGIDTQHLTAEEAAARQVSAEAAEASRIERAEHGNIVETLAGMFPCLDKDIIVDVVRQKQGRVGSAVDACLALNT